MSMNEMSVLDCTGHTKHIWDSDKEDEVDAAEALYDSMIKKGYTAFKVKRDGSEGARMTEFDPAAEKMILMRQLQGG